MAVSPWSMSFRQAPGYAAAAPTTTTPAPTFTAPSMPTVPVIDDARAPNAASRSFVQTQLGMLPGKYQPLLDQARVNARYALAGYGGVRINDDNSVTFDPGARLGQKEKAAVRGEENAANSRGLLFSSFANQAIGSALTRMNEEKRAVVNQFAASINNTLMTQSQETTSLIGDWVRMYGEDSRFLAENPPPPPPAPPPPPPPPAPPAPVPLPPGTMATPTSPAGSFPTWTGTRPPNLASLAKAWGVPRSAIRVSVVRGKYSAWPQLAPDTGPRF